MYIFEYPFGIKICMYNTLLEVRATLFSKVDAWFGVSVPMRICVWFGQG